MGLADGSGGRERPAGLLVAGACIGGLMRWIVRGRGRVRVLTSAQSFRANREIKTAIVEIESERNMG